MLASSVSCFATIRTSPTLSYHDVTNTIGLCSFGDTVVLPAGTNWWSQTVTIQGITLQGQGTNSTTIQDETPIQNNGIPILVALTTNAALTRICYIQFTQGVTNNVNSNPNNFDGNIVVGGNNPKFRIDDCYFNRLTGKHVLVNDDSFGVIDHNSFTTVGRISIEVFGNIYGDFNWSQPEQLGTSNFVFVEDNQMTDVNNFGWIDTSQGGRVVFRHNSMTGSFFETHGTETPGRPRSVRAFECYQNNFFWTTGQQYSDFYTAVDIRGGTGVVWGNQIVGYYSTITLQSFRAAENSPVFAPWYGATGTNCFDNITNVATHTTNQPLFSAQYTVNSSSNTLYVPFTQFTPHFFVGYTVFDTNNNLCGIVQDNDLNTLTFAQIGGGFQFQVNSNDWYSVYLVYPQIDQIGMGAGNNLGNNFNPTQLKWVNEASEPFYNWSNNLTIMYERYYPFTNVSIISGYPNVQMNRDFYNTNQPGYTPFVYPFPLVSQQQVTNPAIIVPLGKIAQISSMH